MSVLNCVVFVVFVRSNIRENTPLLKGLYLSTTRSKQASKSCPQQTGTMRSPEATLPEVNTTVFTWNCLFSWMGNCWAISCFNPTGCLSLTKNIVCKGIGQSKTMENRFQRGIVKHQLDIEKFSKLNFSIDVDRLRTVKFVLFKYLFL